jgi:peptidoglycan/LPS O-acetylase OafA/YrhL
MVFHTLSTLANFVIGALAAYIAFYRLPVFERLTKLSRAGIGVVYVLLLINLAFHHEIYSSPFLIVAERSVFACFFAFVILEQVFFENSPFKWSKLKIMAYLGKRSYGFYCYHGVLITFFIKITGSYNLSDSFAEVFIINPVLLFFSTLAVGMASYHYAEQPLLKWKNKFYSSNK